MDRLTELAIEHGVGTIARIIRDIEIRDDLSVYGHYFRVRSSSYRSVVPDLRDLGADMSYNFVVKYCVYKNKEDLKEALVDAIVNRKRLKVGTWSDESDNYWDFTKLEDAYE